MSYYDREYTTVEDARTALINSGVLELFDDVDTVADWMWRAHATPQQAAEAFDVI